jgi:predicted transcriptional regulator of viral defense system
MRAGISRAGRERLSQVLGKGRRLITVEDAARALHERPREVAKQLSIWAGNGWLRRVRRGLYIPVPVEASEAARWSDDPLYLADAVWTPCYFTGWTSAGHWSLTEQLFKTTVLKTTQRVRTSEQHLLEHSYLVAHTATAGMWGLATVWRNDRKLQMADPSRTVLDILDEPALAGGIRHASDILRAYLEEHDGKELLAYGDRLGNRTVFKRLGYLVELLHIGRPELVALCRQRLSAGLARLDPGGPAAGRIVSKWGLRVNVPLAPEMPS